MTELSEPMEVSEAMAVVMTMMLLRTPYSETHQHDQSEPMQAAPPDPARSNYWIGVPRPGSTVSNLYLAQMRSVNWLGQFVEHLVGAFRYALPMEPNTSSKHKQDIEAGWGIASNTLRALSNHHSQINKSSLLIPHQPQWRSIP